MAETLDDILRGLGINPVPVADPESSNKPPDEMSEAGVRKYAM